MDILQLAEENFLITFAIVFGIGLLQGAILARGIRQRFPKLKKYAKGVSIILLILFVINASGNITKFADPSKVEMNEFVVPETPEGIFNLLIDNRTVIKDLPLFPSPLYNKSLWGLKISSIRFNNNLGSIEIIIGDDEIKNGAVCIKNMDTGDQEDVPLSNVIDSIAL